MISMRIGLLQQQACPFCLLPSFPIIGFKDARRKMLGDKERDALTFCNHPCSHTCPLTAVGVQHIWFAVAPPIVLIHLPHDTTPTLLVRTDTTRNGSHISTIDLHPIHLFPPSPLASLEVESTIDRHAQLHTCQHTHNVSLHLQSMCLIQSEESAMRREERWYFEYMHKSLRKRSYSTIRV